MSKRERARLNRERAARKLDRLLAFGALGAGEAEVVHDSSAGDDFADLSVPGLVERCPSEACHHCGARFPLFWERVGALPLFQASLSCPCGTGAYFVVGEPVLAELFGAISRRLGRPDLYLEQSCGDASCFNPDHIVLRCPACERAGSS